MTVTTAISRARVRDVGALRRLFRRALRDDFQYFPPVYIDSIGRQNSFWRLQRGRLRSSRLMYLARVGNKVVGYALGSVTPDHNGELYWLYVDPAQRSHNLGAELLQVVIDDLRARGCHKLTLVTYDLADYYRRHGFRHTGTQRIHGLDLGVMEYTLNG